MTINEFEQLCQNRRSIRYFDGKQVQKADMLKLLAVAQLAPSVENTQPWHFHVVYDKTLLKKLMECSCYGNFVEGAGVFVVVTCDRSLQTKMPEPVWNIRELEFSCMAAMENMMLGATAMGLGSCWVSLLHGDVQAMLKVPLKEVIVGGVMIGHYKKDEAAGNDEHVRKPLETMYTMYE